jgi:hypothetical protein
LVFIQINTTLPISETYHLLDAGVLALNVKYTPNYPDELPEFHVESIEGELTDEQRERIVSTLTASVRSVAYGAITPDLGTYETNV